MHVRGCGRGKYSDNNKTYERSRVCVCECVGRGYGHGQPVVVDKWNK